MCVEDLPLPELLGSMQRKALGQSSPLAMLAMVDGKTFCCLVVGKQWLLLDSHARSVSGREQALTSLVAHGRLEMDFVLTIGEMLTRGGQDAAYRVDSRGGFWALTHKDFA